MTSMTGNIEVRGKTVFSLFIILVTGVALGIALRLGTQHERNKSHACFASDFQSTQEFTSNDAFSRLEPITASNAAEIIQANEKEQLKSLRELINEITFSPFESTVSGSDHAVLLLAAKSHDTVGRLSLGKREYVNSIEFNPSRTCIAVGSSLGKVRFLSTETGQEQQAIKTGNWVTTIAFSPDGKMLAYGTQGDNDSIGEVTIGIWDLEANKEFHILKGHTWSISGLVFSSNGQILASSSIDGTIRLWDVQTGQELEILKGYTGQVTDLAFNHSGDLLAIAGANGAVGLLNLETDAITNLSVYQNEIEDILFGPGDIFLAIVGTDADQIWITKDQSGPTSIKIQAEVHTKGLLPNHS